MASKVDIFNSTLTKLGEGLVSSVDDPNKPARTLKAQYELSRRMLLRTYQWNFAIKRASLAPDATAPEFGYDNRFLIPNDCLKFLGIYDENDAGYRMNYSGAREPHKLEGGYILADVNPLRCFYVSDVSETGAFDPAFTEALAWLLAVDVGIALTNAPKKVEAAAAGLERMIKIARQTDAMEGTPEMLMSTEWLDARFGLGVRGPWRIGPVSGF